MITNPWGDPLTRRELLRQMGSTSQGVSWNRTLGSTTAQPAGVHAFRFRTGSGLSFDVIPEDPGRGPWLRRTRRHAPRLALPERHRRPRFPRAGRRRMAEHLPRRTPRHLWHEKYSGRLASAGAKSSALATRLTSPATPPSFDTFWDEGDASSTPAGRSGSPASSARTIDRRRRIRTRAGTSRGTSRTKSKTKVSILNR